MFPIKEIIYDVKKDFEGGKVTDDSKASIRHLEQKADDIRANIIPQYYASKRGFQELDDLWLQTVTLKEKDIAKTDDCSVTFNCPKVMWVKDGAGLTYVGNPDGTFSLPTIKNIGISSPYYNHKHLKNQRSAIYNNRQLKINNEPSMEEVTIQAIFSEPMEAYLWEKTFNNDQAKEVEKEVFREQVVYPIGALIDMLKKEMQKELRLLYNMPVDRMVDDRHTNQVRNQES